MVEPEILAALGFASAVDAPLPPAYLAVAQRLASAAKSELRTVGFLPASKHVAVPPVVTRLGLALSQISGATVGFVDANLRWPATAGQVHASAAEAASAFVTRWLHDSFALLVPSHRGEAGAGVPELQRLITDGNELFAHLLIDLTGFARFGEHLAAAKLVDALVVVARAHVDSTSELATLSDEIQESRFLGVLLVD